MNKKAESILRAVERAKEEMAAFAAELVKVPTVNPPGEFYADCAGLIGDKLKAFQFEVQTHVAADRPEHSASYPRVNVVGRRSGLSRGPKIHLNGHFDVVPAGDGWTEAPFAGTIKEGRLFGRGSADMKGGLACAIFAAEAMRRAGISLNGSLSVSATCDEESGGFAGVGWLAERGFISSTNTDFAIIPEPLEAGRIGIGHRGVYWLKITSHGRTGHGCMPFLGVNAIENLAFLLEEMRTRFSPFFAQRRTEMPVVPAEARHPTLNINSIAGGQLGNALPSPCVADSATVVLDRRFLPEEGFEKTREEIRELVNRVQGSRPDCRFEIEDLMVVRPVQTPSPSPLVAALESAIRKIRGKEAVLVASPGTYDHKHFTHIGKVEHCVAYGPGRLEQAHQPDEWCSLDDMVDAAKIMALTILDLTEK